MSMIDISAAERRIAERISSDEAHDIRVMAGGVAFRDVSQVMEFAKMMAIGGIAVRKHLRGNPGACLAIVVQALEWGFSPYAVANKSYLVNDQVSYEAQLIEAVILKRAPIKGRPKTEYSGTGAQRRLKVWAELRDVPGEIVEYTSPIFSDITPKNSPLWKSDPDQQLHYYSVRAWCRRHFPDAILGVIALEEAEDFRRADRAVDITPKSLNAKLDALAAGAPDSDEDEEQAISAESRPDHTESAAKASTEAPATAPPAAAQESAPEAEAEDDTFPGDKPSQIQPAAVDRAALIQRLDAAAKQGARKLKAALVKLTPDEQRVLTGADEEALYGVANHADTRGAGG